MWEKISGLMSVVVVVRACMCVCVFGCIECNSVLRGCVFVCLTGQERVIVTVLYPICGTATSSVNVHSNKKHV